MQSMRVSVAYHPERCVACYTCQVACKQEHALPVNTHWIKIFRHPVSTRNGRLSREYSVSRCLHCEEPDCIGACPEGAISKSAAGVVLVNEDACSGCRLCVEACSFNAMDFDEENNVAAKCTLCVHLIEKGAEPACVKHCPTGALELQFSPSK
jgi:Fe-S-cluster-containing dehydrogenase component